MPRNTIESIHSSGSGGELDAAPVRRVLVLQPREERERIGKESWIMRAVIDTRGARRQIERLLLARPDWSVERIL